MSKLLLQDSDDVGRHTLGGFELYWPRFQPTVVERFAALALICIPACVGMAVLFLDELLRSFVVCAALLFLIRRFRERRTAKKSMLLQCSVVLLLPMAQLHLPHAYQPLSFCLSVLMSLTLTEFVVKHYVSYLSGHHHNTQETLQKWRSAFEDVWCVSNFTPARDLSGHDLRSFRLALRAFAGIRARAVIVLLAASMCGLYPLRPASIVVLLLLFPFLLLNERTQHAALAYLNTPPTRDADTAPGWLARSPVGTLSQRRADMALVAFVVAALHAPYINSSASHIATLVDGVPLALVLAGINVCLCAATLIITFSAVVLPTITWAHALLDGDMPESGEQNVFSK